MNIREFKKYLLEKNKKVICFGTGLMCEEALSIFEIKSAVEFLMDNDTSKQGKRIKLAGSEYTVYSPEEGIKKLRENMIILVTSGHFNAMKEQLNNLKLANTVEVYVYPVLKVNYSTDSVDFFEDRILNECLKEYEVVLNQYSIEEKEREKKLDEMRKYIIGNSMDDRPFVIPRAMVMPTTRCNLRCKGCSSLLPYFEHPSDVSIERILKDFNIFFSSIDKCIRITVGGEPFLYPYLKEILDYLIDEPKVLGIMLISNSTLQPKDEVIQRIKNPKVYVEISDYGHLEKMSKLISLLEDNEVNFSVLTEQTWTDMGGVECRNRSKEEIRFNYLNCDQSRVIKGMHDGKFYTCARSARMIALGAYASQDDYFELQDDDSPTEVRNKLKKMYYSDFADACNYCDLGSLPTRVIEAGIQMNECFKKSAYTIVNREEYEKLKKIAKFIK